MNRCCRCGLPIITEVSCGCCAGTEHLTPQPITNRPGLPALSYRVGTHPTFLETMKARLSSHFWKEPGKEAGADGQRQSQRITPLLNLKTREESDPAIALLDAWATVSDVLTFYQERFANESYLRTATERHSVLEMARLIGYRLSPGVASSVFLAYTLENNFKEEALIPAGAQAQSIPGPGELPQVFETSEPLPARTAWNQLKPSMGGPQDIRPGGFIPSDTIYFKGTSTYLKPNALLLLDFANAVQELYSVVDVRTDVDPALDRSAVKVRPRIKAEPWPSPPGEEDCIPFDYRQAVVQKIGGRWKIVVGNMLLLDFGANEAEARRALEIIKHYKMNKQCFVGRPDPSMVYYLADDQAPAGKKAGEDCIGFNPDRIEVAEIGGRYKIVEGNRWILDFGDNEDEANNSLAIIRNYGFQYICFVGRPDPSMSYFRKGRRDGDRNLICTLFDYRSAEITIDKMGNWTIVDRAQVLLNFGDKQVDAEKALAIIKHYRMNQQCYIQEGKIGRLMEYYLVNGDAPIGAIEGEDCISFNPERVNVKKIEGRWKIVEGNHWILDFGDNEHEANNSLAIIRNYGFQYICFVGRPDPSMIYFRRDKVLGLKGLINPLTKKPSLQPANRIQLSRDVNTIYAKRSDMIPAMLTNLFPATKDTLFQAWRKKQVSETQELKSIEAFRIKAAPFGHNAPRMPECTA